MSSPKEFNCIFCKETFENKEDLQIHFRKHGDPKFNQSQKGKSRPQAEAQTSVEKKSEDVEMVSCDVCPEMFPTISKAITHKHKVHPDHDAKHFCPWCGKLFTMKHLYNKHLQSNHMDLERNDNSNFHCDACDVNFFIPSAMLYHNKFFHRQDTDLPTIGQSKKLKMCQQEALQIFYCAFCGDEYDNKVNLHKHMGDDHGDENQSPEDVLRCPLCEAIFYHLDAYEVHLTFHSGEDLYSEKNEMFEQIEEFSLETVPPVEEKVENAEPQADVESEMNAVGIDKFLEMAMGDTLEKDGDDLKTKSKKHKKHKKKKKEAITLDEFLNMNKDVFGEGLDFQGIEEVPTQVVAKRLKQMKTVRPTMSNLKVAPSSELEKLKKQGIVVKIKPTKRIPIQNLKVGNKIITKPMKTVNKPSTNVQCTPDEVISKLINQTNSQIKIVKKISQDKAECSPKEPDNEDNAILDIKGCTPEKIEVECDVNMPSEYTSSENETKEENTEKREETAISNGQLLISNKYDKNSDGDKNNENQNNLDFNNEGKGGNDSNNESNVKNIKMNEETNKDDETLNPDDDMENKINPVCSNNSKLEVAPEEKSIADEKSNDKEENDFDKDIKPNESASSSLNALKHLSHLITVKSVNPKKKSTPVSPLQHTENSQNNTEINQSQDDSDVEKPGKDEDNLEETLQSSVTKEKSLNNLNPLKNLSKNITIKPVVHSPKQNSNNSDDDEDGNNTSEMKTIEKITSNTQAAKLATPAKSSDVNVPSTKGQNISKSSNFKEMPTVIEKQSNINLLKHLTNVTAKPVNTLRSNVQQMTSNTTNRQNITKPNVKPSPIQNQEIEIFNIDDSDDEEDNHPPPPVTKTNSPKPSLLENKNVKSIDSLKNISKHITVKPVNQQGTPNVKTNTMQTHSESSVDGVHSKDQLSDFSDEDDDQNTLIPTNYKTIKPHLQNDHLKNTLKNLGKHITVKSGNPSPNSSGKDYNSRDNFQNDEGDSDDSYSGKVKITEVTDDQDMSDDDMAERSNKTKHSEPEGNISVKSPGASNSDHDNIDDAEDEEFSDLEHQIKSNTLKKPDPNINKIINMNKNITVKSLGDKKGQSSKQIDTNIKNILPNINSALSIKSMKQTKSDNVGGEESLTNRKGIMNAAQVKRSIINQNQSMNHAIASTNQHNTVNKEVTVQTKTFQTKTVIQEITTTVTKTIKTVNQTVKQEVQSTSQNNVVKFQKIQGMKATNQSPYIKNFQGVTVRHATPVAGTKIRGGMPQNIRSNIRPSNQLVPCNQLVPVRPRNTARMSVPRMPFVNRNAGPASVTQPRPNMTRPLKISPNAVSTKRNADEPGHFSCFKKPKESLIPEVNSSANEQGGESMVQFSSSQMSKSNVTCATKTVRGKTVVTQMKSEVSSSSQHLEKLNSVSGLKVVKTSQSKQATKVEEKCEMSPSKRNALEAIERLRKQGLLVKKPRLDDAANESDHSDGNADGEDYTTEEPDD